MIRDLEQDGYNVNTSGGNHIRITGRGVLVFMSFSPSDTYRFTKNTRSEIARQRRKADEKGC